MNARNLVMPAILLACATLCIAQVVHGSSDQGDIAVTKHIALNAPVDEVFPLFYPANRSQWDHDWETDLVPPNDRGAPRQGQEFRRTSDPETKWSVERLDVETHLIQFLYERPKRYVMRVTIHCEAQAATTTATVTYSAVARSEAVREALVHHLDQQITDLVSGEEGWETKINHYLRTGGKLPRYEPLAIERRHTIEFRDEPAKIFSRMNPARGNHWTASTPKYVFGSPDNPSEAMWRTRDGWMVVAEYNPETLSMKTVLYIPDIEFMIEEASCESGPSGGTLLTVVWRVAGLSPRGNEAVQNFFDTHWKRRMDAIKQAYTPDLGAR